MTLIIKEPLPNELYFIIGNAFIPIALISWIIAYTEMVARDSRKLAITLILIFSAVFEIIFFSLLFIDINLLGVINPLVPFSADFGLFLTIFLLATILIVLATGLKFAQQSIHSEQDEIRLKGKLLQAAFIIFTIATILEKTARSILLGVVFDDPSDPILTLMLAIVRTLLIISAFAFYGGFLLPRWIKELFLKEE